MAELRKEGYRIRVRHFRKTQHGVVAKKEIREKPGYYVVDPRGGRVEVEMTTSTGVQVKSKAECSEQDNYVRRIGTAMAFGLALKARDMIGEQAGRGFMPDGRVLIKGAPGIVRGSRWNVAKNCVDYVVVLDSEPDTHVFVHGGHNILPA